MVGFPSPQELGGEDFAEEGARVFHSTHLDVSLVQEFISHTSTSSSTTSTAAAAVKRAPAARPRAHLTVIIIALRLQQWLALLTLIRLVIMQLVAQAAAVKIHVHAQIFQRPKKIASVINFQSEPRGEPSRAELPTESHSRALNRQAIQTTKKQIPVKAA